MAGLLKCARERPNASEHTHTRTRTDDMQYIEHMWVCVCAPAVSSLQWAMVMLLDDDGGGRFEYMSCLRDETLRLAVSLSDAHVHDFKGTLHHH